MVRTLTPIDAAMLAVVLRTGFVDGLPWRYQVALVMPIAIHGLLICLITLPYGTFLRLFNTGVPLVPRVPLVRDGGF